MNIFSIWICLKQKKYVGYSIKLKINKKIGRKISLEGGNKINTTRSISIRIRKYYKLIIISMSSNFNSYFVNILIKMFLHILFNVLDNYFHLMCNKKIRKYMQSTTFLSDMFQFPTKTKKESFFFNDIQNQFHFRSSSHFVFPLRKSQQWRQCVCDDPSTNMI